MLSNTVDKLCKTHPAVNVLKGVSRVHRIRPTRLRLSFPHPFFFSFSLHPRLDECIMRACSSPRIPVKSLISCPCGLAFSLSRAGMPLLRVCE